MPTHRVLGRAAETTLVVGLVRHLRLFTALLAATLAVSLAAQVPRDASAADSTGMAQKHRVGHTLKRMEVKGSAKGETRQVDVHLWYPADVHGLSDRPKAMYTSALHGKQLLPARWDPLSWTVEAELAREGAAIDPNGPALPVIVFSHGSVNNAIDYAHTLELIAGSGFVVAAPDHVNNTQDDVRRDYANARARPARLFECADGRPASDGNCNRAPAASSPELTTSMRDRFNDISGVLDRLPNWLGDRVDAERAGVMGHSRGTVTALSAAGGSTAWTLKDGDPRLEGAIDRMKDGDYRVKAVMGMAIGARAIRDGADVAEVHEPTLLVAGVKDALTPPLLSREAFDRISSEEKAFVTIDNATHRSFDSTYCDQAQTAGAAFDKDPPGHQGHGTTADEVRELDKNGDGLTDAAELENNTRLILDFRTLSGIVRGGTSGSATQYCSRDTFEKPVDIKPLVESLTGSPFPPNAPTSPPNVPTAGLDTDEVKSGIHELATTFFGTVLKRNGSDGPHFTRYLAPKWLAKHESMVGDAEACAGDDAVLPPGQEEVPDHQEENEVAC